MRISDWSSDVCSSDLVYPRPEASPPSLPSAAGLGSAQAHRGRGDELHHLRDYRSGDPMRDVAWKSSARAGQLLVREYEQPIANELCLAWPDTHGLAHEARISRDRKSTRLNSSH